MLGIDKAICLCLDKRKEEWLDLEKQCLSKNIPFEKFVVGDGKTLDPSEYDRIDDPNPPVENWSYGNEVTKINHCNAFLSHQAIIKKAKEDGLNSILLLEDDAYFTERFDDVISKLENAINLLPFDMLFLGWWIGEADDEWNETVERLYNENEGVAIGKVSEAHFTCGGLHGVVIMRTMFDKILELEPTDPIDSQLNQSLHDEINSFYVIPKIIHDKGIFSHCEQGITPRKKL